jgi:hypothetical protein
MDQNSRTEREKCYAKVIFKDENLPGYVRDISKKGCRLDLLEEVSWEPGTKKKIVIIPEEEVGFSPVHGTVEIRWIKKKDIYWSIGTEILSVQDETSKENYISLLQYFEEMRIG